MCTYIEVSTVKSVLVNHTAENPHKNKKTKKQTKNKRTENTFRLLRTAACTCVLHRQVMYESTTWAFGRSKSARECVCARTAPSHLPWHAKGEGAGRGGDSMRRREGGEPPSRTVNIDSKRSDVLKRDTRV